ncbi:MAG: hypothetical protein K6347_01015 [Campylobacterales bacterium]
MAGCAPKTLPLPNQTALLTLKTTSMHIEEPVFVTRTSKVVRLDFATRITETSAVEVSAEQICFEGRCMGSEEFNRRFLDPAFEPDLLWRLLTQATLPNSSVAILLVEGDSVIVTNKERTVYLSLRSLE